SGLMNGLCWATSSIVASGSRDQRAQVSLVIGQQLRGDLLPGRNEPPCRHHVTGAADGQRCPNASVGHIEGRERTCRDVPPYHNGRVATGVSHVLERQLVLLRPEVGHLGVGLSP